MLKKTLLSISLSLLATSAFAQMNNDVTESYPKSYLFYNQMVDVGSNVYSATMTLVADNGCNITGGGHYSWEIGEEVAGHNYGRVHMDNTPTCSLSVEVNIKHKEEQSITVIPMDIPVIKGELQYPELSDAAKLLMLQERVKVSYAPREMSFSRDPENAPVCVVWGLGH